MRARLYPAVDVGLQNMIEPRDSIADRRHASGSRVGWPLEQQHPYAELARRGDLAVSRRAAAVLGDHDIDRMTEQQCSVLVLAERPATVNVVSTRKGKRWFDWINTANEISVLGRVGKLRDLLAAQREEYAPRLKAEDPNGIVRAPNFGPPVTVDFPPGRPAQREHRSVGLRCGGRRVSGDPRRIRMSGIDQCMDLLLKEIPRETVDPPEAAAARGNGLNRRGRRASGEREGHAHVVAGRQPLCELPGLRRATENQDMCAHAAH